MRDDKNHKKNWVELREEEKFLHYEEIQQVLKELQSDFLGGQADAGQVEALTAPENLAKKAKQLQKVCYFLKYRPFFKKVAENTFLEGLF